MHCLCSRFAKNYAFSEGSVLACRDIIEHAARERESLQIATALNPFSLGFTVKDIWSGKVKKVRKGPRLDQKRSLLNVACKRYQGRSSDVDMTHKFEELAKDDSFTPKGWFKIVDSQNKVSFVRPGRWEFDNQRIYTEIAMELSPEKKVTCCIKSHGNVITLADLNVERILQDLPVKMQAETVIQFVEGSQMCLGYRLPEDGSITTLSPHKAGILKSLSDDKILPQKGAFSLKCQLFCYSAGMECPLCTNLKKADMTRKRRKNRRKSIHSHCNKRYLTKEEIQQQLKEERTMKNKYLQEKLEMQSSDSEDGEDTSQEFDAEEEIKNERE